MEQNYLAWPLPAQSINVHTCKSMTTQANLSQKYVVSHFLSNFSEHFQYYVKNTTVITFYRVSCRSNRDNAIII